MRRLPAVGSLLERAEAVHGDRLARYSRARLVTAVQEVLGEVRERLRTDSGEVASPDEVLDAAFARLELADQPHLAPVVNATGVVLNTNLGRAPLADEAVSQLSAVGAAYSNLEIDLATGKRGSRHAHVEELLVTLTGAEAAIVVNNGAAAVLLAVDTLARGQEVVVSRGQLIEIGGSFRLPDVITASGARLVEVGTTNKTYLADYRRALTPATGLLLRSHTSNYRILGFTAEVSPAELAALGQERGIPTMEDLGSGVLVDLAAFGLPHEPTVQQSIAAGLDLVSFSGDKLLGGPQAGILIGRRKVIQRLKQNPLLRALRQDKLTLAALEVTLRLYLDPARALDRIPTLRLLARPLSDLEAESRALAEALGDLGKSLTVRIVPGTSPVGGGSMPTVELSTALVELRSGEMPAHVLAARLREGDPPVIARVAQDAVLLDPRTLLPGDAGRIAAALERVFP